MKFTFFVKRAFYFNVVVVIIISRLLLHYNCYYYFFSIFSFFSTCIYTYSSDCPNHKLLFFCSCCTCNMHKIMNNYKKYKILYYFETYIQSYIRGSETGNNRKKNWNWKKSLPFFHNYGCDSESLEWICVLTRWDMASWFVGA